MQSFIDYLQNFSWSKFFISLLLLVIGLASLTLYQSYTQSINLERAKLSLELANQANDYRQNFNGLALSQKQQSIYDSALEIAEKSIKPDYETVKFNHDTMKFLAGLLPWLLMAFVYVGEKTSKSYIGMFGAVIFGVMTAGLLALIPDIAWPWLNLAVFPIVPFLLILTFFATLKQRSP